MFPQDWINARIALRRRLSEVSTLFARRVEPVQDIPIAICIDLGNKVSSFSDLADNTSSFPPRTIRAGVAIQMATFCLELERGPDSNSLVRLNSS